MGRPTLTKIIPRGVKKGVKIKIFGPVFRCFSPEIDPGVLLKDPGVLSKDPGVLLKDPGALLKDPGVL